MSASSQKHVLVVAPQAVGDWWAEAVVKAAAGDYTPRRHQTQFLEWLADKPGAMAAVGMGGGKTLMAIMAASLVGRPAKPVLLNHGPTKKRAATLRKAIEVAHPYELVCVANYDAVYQGDLGKAIQKVPWRWIILDESHRAKSPQGRCSKWLAALAASNPHARRLALTGTPMPNGMLDMYGQFRFVERSVFGDSFVRFRARYAECNPMFPSQVRRYIRQDEFARLTDPFIWRVATEDVLDLPEETHQRIGISLDLPTARFYKELERELTAMIGDGTVTCANALAKTVRLRQATGGYARRDGDETATRISPKADKRKALEDFLEDFGDRPLVVFYVFTSDAFEIRDVCRETGRRYSEVSGAEKTLAAWQAGESDVIGVQLRSGAEGIDLTRAAHAVFYSIDWSPGVYEQAVRRLRRPGQQASACHYYHLVAENTIDEAIYRALVNKSDVVNGVLSMLSSRKEGAAWSSRAK